METLSKTKWAIDTVHSEIGFKIKHMMISTVTGYFDDFTATIETDNDEFKNADINFSAKIHSINTKNDYRDNHLRSDDFFNAEKYPELVFKSKSFDGEKLVGDLTIRDVTKEVTLDVEFNGIMKNGNESRAGFEISGKINRKNFNLNWSATTETGGLVVSDEVKLIINAEFIMQA